MRGDKIIVYNDHESSKLPDEFEVEVDSDQTPVIDYKDPDSNPRTCNEIYLVDKSGNTVQLFQAKRGLDNPCILLSKIEEISEIGSTKLDPEKRKEELRLGRGAWVVKFFKGYVISKKDIQNIDMITNEMRENQKALLKIKEDGYKERISEVKSNCDEQVALIKEEREQYRQALLNISKDSATAEAQTVTNMIEMVARQARSQRGRLQTGSRIFATATKKPEKTPASTENTTTEEQNASEEA